MCTDMYCNCCGNSINEHNLKKQYTDGNILFLCPICNSDLSNVGGAYVRSSKYCFAESSSQVYMIHKRS
ncbi:hypothetical protein [uncultured Clostridium sp.]|uniref:hypothetical protein n=1 Tax=uncultured Clostridium sp. TaxID=59620 RepID=UPI0026F3B27C|nr:hypothetical protein [uncultured Clostridium sp.]